MAKTYQNVLTEARVLLQDVDETAYRDSDEVLLAKLNRALQEIARLRPDAFTDTYSDAAVNSGGSLNVPEVVSLTDPVGIDLMFYTPLVYFVAASAELKDDEFTNDSRVSVLMSQFRMMLIGL